MANSIEDRFNKMKAKKKISNEHTETVQEQIKKQIEEAKNSKNIIDKRIDTSADTSINTSVDTCVQKPSNSKPKSNNTSADTSINTSANKSIDTSVKDLRIDILELDNRRELEHTTGDLKYFSWYVTKEEIKQIKRKAEDLRVNQSQLIRYIIERALKEYL